MARPAASWASRTRCWPSRCACGGWTIDEKKRRVRERPPTRSARARRGLCACSWRPSPRAGRRGQRRAAHQWAPSRVSTQKSLILPSAPPRRRTWPTGSLVARRPCNATSCSTRIHVSTMEACSASIESRADVKIARRNRVGVAALICSSPPPACEMMRSSRKSGSGTAPYTATKPTQRRRQSPNGSDQLERGLAVHSHRLRARRRARGGGRGKFRA